MEIEYVLLADAANNGPESKLNVLGVGARILTYERLPASSPLALIAAASAPASEAGEYPVEIAIVEPDGTREVMVQTVGRIAATVLDERVPTGMGILINVLRPFRIEGVHRFEVRIGGLTKTYEFLVRLVPVAQARPEPAAAAAAT